MHRPIHLILSCWAGMEVVAAFVTSAPHSELQLLTPYPCYRVFRASSSLSQLKIWKDDTRNDEVVEEERLKILQARRKQIRAVLRSAEMIRSQRLENGLVPQLDTTTGQPIKSDGQVAVGWTAFVVVAGFLLLRVGGRAALVSAVGLNFLTDSPELKGNLDAILSTAESMDPVSKVFLFTLCWTVVKCLCFDAGGVALAFASGILFGGVVQGAILSAAAATMGSAVAFGVAKLNTPVRQKALQLLEEYPSLRGIEKVVAQDGLKAVLTLRLAPILPIPLGMYNYVYGVTNVPFTDFALGIFLGSLKPYLLDSYLGYFGMSLIEGTTDDTGLQDILLLVVVGFTVLIGVFASQLATETWDSVLKEVEAERKAKKGTGDTVETSVRSEFLGWKLPSWMIQFQIGMQEADVRVRDCIVGEYEAKVWNYTDSSIGVPKNLDPAYWPNSPETQNANRGINVTASVFDGIVLSPLLLEHFLKFADPLYNETEDESLQGRLTSQRLSTSGDENAKLEELLLNLKELRTQVSERLHKLEAISVESASSSKSSSSIPPF